MDNKISRRGLFSAIPSLLKENLDSRDSHLDIKEKEEAKDFNLIRPPYISEESDFSLCKDCEGYCISKCEEKILQRYEDGSVYVVFNSSGCTFCGECYKACNKGVLIDKDNRKISAKVQIITERCLAWNKTMCFSCKDPCLDDAIKFEGLFKPKIITDKCSGCGFCIITCPVNAIVARSL
ncbi:MAG: ferredoxin-type protein NapF [Sulfurihydrogenibium sp.]|nr:ferredoxin-type protein NapF [Sulfurihydrogenibium sp.]